MRKKLISIAMGVALIASTRTLFGAEDPKHPCAQVRDNADRLACYDQAFGKPANSVAAPAVKFGLPAKEVPQHSGENAAQASVSAVISSLIRQHDGKFVVTLDNAQVWSQTELNSQADVEAGDTITVRRGALGSYLLVTKAGIGTRVKRVK
jgi:hypothetical protein